MELNYNFDELVQAAAQDPQWDVADEIREMPYFLDAMMLWF